MFKSVFWLISLFFLLSCGTKPPATKTKASLNEKNKTEESQPYRSSYTQYADLIHTKLEVSLDWKNQELHGKETLILRPHFYSSDSVVLNARGMEILELGLQDEKGQRMPLKYEYDSRLLNIHLNKVYTKEETYTLNIDYIARPEKLKSGGSASITNDKGLYFINADSSDTETPTQLWTQGETESNSAWFPTIEDPKQKMTQEIYVTVDTAFTTLSNGLLLSSVINKDGTKTDYWKQSLPAAPYLTMIAVGKYAVVKDNWKNREVSYYVDPPYEKYARMIFGNTPEMMTFFEDKLHVPFMWEKYAQIVVHDYVSGAMENTTAVVQGTNMQQDPRDFMDGNYEDYIAHELFHHWFGDLITCESWSNIPLNEGFANYGEYLWREHKYGRENADNLNLEDQSGYLYSATKEDPPLIRFHYENREDVYDAVSYNKGGRVLHMLRKYVGDSAFFESLRYYLNAHIFGSVEINDLRLAFEKTTGEDLNWFFNQWYLQGGHPEINISYNWNDSLQIETVTILQKQNLSKSPLYRLPMYIDIYSGRNVIRKKITVEEAQQQFQFKLTSKPDLVNVDAEKMLLCNKTDKKTNTELIFQYEHAPLFLDRYEAVTKIGSSYYIKTPEADLMLKALNDRFYAIRLAALNYIGELALNDPDTLKEKLLQLTSGDSSAIVREKALTVLGKYYSYKENKDFFYKALKDSSYKVVARAFKIISEKDKEKASELAIALEKDSGRAILSRLSEFYNNSTADKTDFYKRALRLNSFYSRYAVLKDFQKYLENINDLSILIKGIDIISERAARPVSRHYRFSYDTSLREIETSIDKKITTLEEQLLTVNDPVIRTEKQETVIQWKSLKNKLHARNNAIEK